MELFKLWGNILINNDDANKSLHNTQKESQNTANKFLDMASKGSSAGQQINGAFNKASDLLKGFGIEVDAGVLKWATYGAAAVAGLAVVTQKLFEISKATAQHGDEIDKQSQKLDVTAEQYQVLAFAAEHSGTSIDKFTTASAKLANSDFDGNVYEFVESLQAIEDPTLRSAKASEVLGEKLANELAPMINGTESMSEYADQLQNLGGIMSGESVSASAKFMDSLTDIQTGFGGISNSLGSKVMPYFQKFLDWIVEQMPTIQNICNKTFDVIGGAIEFTLPIFELLGGAISGILKAVDVTFNALEPIIKPVVDSIVWTINTLIDAIQGLTFGLVSLNKVGSGYNYDAWEKSLNLGSNSESGVYDSDGVLVERFANGGIINSTRAIVGENGAEMIDFSGSKPRVINGSTGSSGNVFNVTIDAHNVRDFEKVVEVFNEMQMNAKMGVLV